MNYPLISEYIEAIKSAEDNFEKLSFLRPVLDKGGQPMMTSGNFAVVFKMKDEQSGKYYALKCFTKEQEGREEAYHQIAEELKDVDSPYLVSIRFLEKELFVDTEQTDETEFPVLLMDWVEGKTLDKYLRENLDDKYVLEMLAYRFSQLAQWLIPQPFAHGDLKPDNILVREDGTLVLVDYDGMYVPAMKGKKARELGSPDFQHPQRTENDFDEHIDDFALLVLTLNILVAYELLSSFSFPFLTVKDFHCLNTSQSLKQIYPSYNTAINKTVSALVNSIIDNDMILPITIYETIAKCVRWEYYNYAQNYYDILKKQGIRPYERFHRKGGFSEDGKLYPVELSNLPASIRGFNIDHEYGYGHYFYKGCLLRAWDCETFSYLGDTYDEGWQEMALPSDTIVIGKEALSDSTFVELIIVPNSVKYIGDKAFYNCENLRYIVFPESIEGFGTDIFNLKDTYVNSKTGRTDTLRYGKGTHSLVDIIVPNGAKEYYANLLPDYRHLIVDFSELANSKDTSIKSLLVNIAKKKEEDNRQLSTIVADEDLANAWIDEYGVMYSKDGKRLLMASMNFNISDYKVRDGVLAICNSAFLCKNIRCITLPDSLIEIGKSTFSGCSRLTSIKIPNNVKSIGNNAFCECGGLTTIEIPNCVMTIGECAFAGCRNLTSIVIPYYITEICWGTFYACSNLVSIKFSNYVTKIAKNAFTYCKNLTSIYIPFGTKRRFEEMLPEYKEILIERI